MMNAGFAVVLFCAMFIQKADEQKPKVAVPSFETKVKGLTRNEGFLTLYVDDQEGTILLQLPASGEQFIYVSGLSSGLGSNPVGLDRGQWGQTRLVRFKRVGKRVFLIEENQSYRATANNAAEKRAVRESFADSVFWATDVVAATDDRVLIDVQSLLVRDAHQVVRKLKSSDQGEYKFDKDLSFVELDRCKSFPNNCELNAMVTYTGKKAGSLVTRVAADGISFTLRLHHSFVKLPEPGYKPRKADPRVASSALTFADYSAPLDKPIEQRLIARHRLEKKSPGAAKSSAVEPIVYYLDPGTPQPVRDALLDGARWWNEAFEAAGFVDAFQVKMLPEDADPMDVRFNVIQWVHRRTRGWSYGQSITDPRTGEIIKGHVLLGSLRVRQDRLIMDGITATPDYVPGRVANACGIAGAGVSDAIAMFAQNASPIDVSLARLRQLSAHEVGHTIGFKHNFAASTYADRASVMDYPAPRVKVAADGSLDLSDAYGVGIGEWDKFMVRYAYSDFGDAEEDGLQELLDEADQRGLLYLSDADARPAAAANPLSNLWDNGTDPVTELRHLMNVRRIAMQKLDEEELVKGQALSDLETVLVPVYLYHRYQIDAVAKMLGGFDYDYAVVGSKRKPVTPIPAAKQKEALDTLLESLQPRDLVVSDRLLKLLAPRPYSSASDRERFESRGAMIFDPDAAARVLAEVTLSQILQPERAARLEAYSNARWNFPVVLNAVTRELLRIPETQQERKVQEIVQHTYVRQLFRLAGDESTSHNVRAAASDQLRSLKFYFERGKAAWPNARHATQVVAEIERFLTRPHTPAAPQEKLTPPPGSPIGG
jgi:hypothetical protein